LAVCRAHGYPQPELPGRIPPRKKRRLIVQFRDRTGILRTAFTRDVSMSGFFVVCEPMPEVGETLVLKLHLPRGGVINVTGKVVRRGRGTAAIEGSAPSGFGFSFQGESEERNKALETLTSVSPSSPGPSP
jgi:hypothetical protein